MNRKPVILVAGLGNELLQDDGVGVHAVRLMRRRLPAAWSRRVVIAEVGVAVLDALPLMENASRVLAIDAMRAGRTPGTLYAAADNEVARWNREAGLHEMGLLGAMELMTGPRPPVAVLGVEPAVIDYGMELSPLLDAALTHVVMAAEECLRRWLGAETVKTASVG